MGSLISIVRYEVLLFLGALALIVFYQLLTGKINSRRLLLSKDRAGGMSPSRTQLLVVSIGVAIYVLAQAISSPGQFPEIAPWIVLLLAGSEAIYLGRKANNLMLRRSIRRSIRRSRSKNSQI